MHSQTTKRWAPKPLEDATKAENGRFVKEIGQSPASVTLKDNEKIFEMRFGTMLRTPVKKAIFKVGEVVRLRLKKQGTFAKSYTEAFSTELYKIQRLVCGLPVYRYKLTDMIGNTISNSFYASDLVRFLPE